MRVESATNAFIQQLKTHGIRIVPCGVPVWLLAAEYRSEGHSLGDSYALATADSEGTTLAVGSDRDFQDVDIETEAIRDGPA